MGPHIVLTTFGSLGDLHPYIAVGLALRERGAQVTLATSELYRAKVEAEGLTFYPLRPDLGKLIDNPEIVKHALHPVTGGRYILRKLMFPSLRESFDDLLPLAREADLLVGHPIAFATPVVADLLRKRWISVLLQPLGLLSAWDPPSVAAVPGLDRLRGLGPGFWRWFVRFGRAVAGFEGAPINRLRRSVGAPEVRHPIFDDFRSRYGVQGWFPDVLATPQPDWPANLSVTGYPFFDEPATPLAPELEQFLAAGTPPVVFTMGSAAVFDAGEFYKESAEAATRAGHRAVLLVGIDSRNVPAAPLPQTVIAVPYAPYAALFPRAAAIVHQGGIGTTCQALRSARPTIVVPYSHDQPDNARRVAALGSSRTVRRLNYRAEHVSEELRTLLTVDSYTESAARAAARVRAEDGAGAAADLLMRRACE